MGTRMGWNRSRTLRRATVVGTSLLAALAVGCGSSDKPSGTTGGDGGRAERVRLAYFDIATASPYNQIQQESARRTAAELGADIDVFDANIDAERQQRQVQDAIATQRYDAFIIMPVNGAAMVSVARQAIDAGIEVVSLFNIIGSDIASTTPEIPGMKFVGYSLEENGEHIGEAMVDACGDKDPCKVAYLPGLFSIAVEGVRRDGVMRVLEAHRNVELVAEQEGGYLANTALNVVTNILQANPDIHVIGTSGDQMTIGAQEALRRRDLTGKIALVGDGASIEGVEAVRRGLWAATVVELPIEDGRHATEAAVKLVNGEEVPDFTDMVPLSPIGPIVDARSLDTPEGKSFEGQWKGN